MATRRRTQSNPFTSANLGSGARTTVGGSYENPRLGIQDYSAFGRGVASTFRLPKEEEIKELELPTIDYIGGLKDSMLGDAAWNENQSTVDQLYNDLIPLQAQYEKCQKANDQQCLRRIEGSLNIIEDGAAKWKNYLSKYVDDEIYDNETSRGQYMIDVNRKNIKKPDGSFLSLADINKVNNERPQDIKYGIVNNKAVYQVKLDGQTYNVNLTDLTENYLNNSFDIRSNIGLDVQTAMASGGFTSDWKDEPTYMNETSKITTENGLQNVTDFTDYKKIVEGLGYFNKAEDKSKVFSSNLYKTISSPNVNSAFHKLTAKIYNGFNTDSKYMPALEDVISKSKDLKSFRTQMSQIPNDIKLEMLQDEAEQEWLIANASNGYRRGDNGRAERLDEKYLIKESETKKPITSDKGGFSFAFGTGSGGSADYYVSGLQQLYGTINPDTEQRQGGIVDNQGNVPLEKVADFAQQWGVNTHGAGTKVFSVAEIEKYYKDLYNYDEAPKSSNNNNNPGKAQIDGMINDIFKQEPSYFYYVPSGGKDPIPAENLGKPPKNISEGVIKGQLPPRLPLTVPINNFMREYRNSLDGSEKKLFEGAASRMGINIYGVQLEPKKKN